MRINIVYLYVERKRCIQQCNQQPSCSSGDCYTPEEIYSCDGEVASEYLKTDNILSG